MMSGLLHGCTTGSRLLHERLSPVLPPASPGYSASDRFLCIPLRRCPCISRILRQVTVHLHPRGPAAAFLSPAQGHSFLAEDGELRPSSS
jgi:hypothetical protein